MKYFTNRVKIYHDSFNKAIVLPVEFSTSLDKNQEKLFFKQYKGKIESMIPDMVENKDFQIKTELSKNKELTIKVYINNIWYEIINIDKTAIIEFILTQQSSLSKFAFNTSSPWICNPVNANMVDEEKLANIGMSVKIKSQTSTGVTTRVVGNEYYENGKSYIVLLDNVKTYYNFSKSRYESLLTGYFYIDKMFLDQEKSTEDVFNKFDIKLLANDDDKCIKFAKSGKISGTDLGQALIDSNLTLNKVLSNQLDRFNFAGLDYDGLINLTEVIPYPAFINDENFSSSVKDELIKKSSDIVISKALTFFIINSFCTDTQKIDGDYLSTLVNDNVLNSEVFNELYLPKDSSTNVYPDKFNLIKNLADQSFYLTGHDYVFKDWDTYLIYFDKSAVACVYDFELDYTFDIANYYVGSGTCPTISGDQFSKIGDIYSPELSKIIKDITNTAIQYEGYNTDDYFVEKNDKGKLIAHVSLNYNNIVIYFDGVVPDNIKAAILTDKFLSLHLILPLKDDGTLDTTL